MRGKLSELHGKALLFYNRGEMEKNCGTNLSHIFPCFSNLLPGIGEQLNIKMCLFEGRLFYNVKKIHSPRM